MSDLPDFYQGTSPGFGMTRTGQSLNRVYWSGAIAASVTQINTTVVNQLNRLFNIDIVHVRSFRGGGGAFPVIINNAPVPYTIELNSVFPPAAAVWNFFYSGFILDGYETIRFTHVSGSGIPNVYSFRETIGNPSWLPRDYHTIIQWVSNEM